MALATRTAELLFTCLAVVDVDLLPVLGAKQERALGAELFRFAVTRRLKIFSTAADIGLSGGGLSGGGLQHTHNMNNTNREKNREKTERTYLFATFLAAIVVLSGCVTLNTEEDVKALLIHILAPPSGERAFIRIAFVVRLLDELKLVVADLAPDVGVELVPWGGGLSGCGLSGLGLRR